MNTEDEVGEIFEGLAALSPAGFAIGLHLEFTTSKYIFQTYKKDWMEEYSRRGFLLADPTVRWGIENLGFIRWSDLAAQDSAGVLSAAAEFGLTYGVSVAVEDAGSRSLGSFAATDREFTDTEIENLTIALSRLHALTNGIETDSPSDKGLRRLAAHLG